MGALLLLLRRLGAVLAAAMLLALSPGLSAQDYPPRPEGPIYDGADMLSPEIEAALDTKLRDYNRETGYALVVATVPDLGGAPIEQYATGLFGTWGIGGAERDTGLLLLVSRDDRKLRIEVGYGLHPWFGGIMAGRVIRDVITPRFKEGDFDAGVTQGIDAIVTHLAKSPEDAVAIEEAATTAAAQEGAEDGFPIGGLIWLAVIIIFFILPMLRGGGRRRRYGGSGLAGVAGDIILWEAGKAIARGISDGDDWGGGGFGGGGFGGGGFGGFGGGMSGGGGASGGW